MSAKPRNNYAKLPWAIRKRVLRLIFDGAEYEAIRRDPEVAAACAARGLTLHNTTFAAVRNSDDYRKYESALMETNKRTGKFKWASEALKTTAGLHDIANVAQLSLLEQLRDLAESSDADPSDLLRLTNAITKIKESAENDKLSELKRRLREKDEEIESKNAEIERLKAEHKAEIERLTAKDNTVADPSRVADELSNLLGVKK